MEERIRNLEHSDLRAAEDFLNRQLSDHDAGTPEHRAIALAIEALTYVRGQKAYLFFEQYLAEQERELTDSEIRNYAILASRFGGQFKKDH